MANIQKILTDYSERTPIDTDTRLQSDAEVKFMGGFRVQVDTVFLQYDGFFRENPRFEGYAHTPNGGYDHIPLTADDITNYDLYEYMEGWDITDLEGLLTKYPEIVYGEE